MPTTVKKRLGIHKRREIVAKMRLQGRTLAEIGREVGVHLATVSKDMKWNQEDWRQRACQDTAEMMAEQDAKNNLLEREAWAAWERSKHKKTIKSVETHGDDTDKQGRSTARQKSMLRHETRTGDPAYLVIVERCLERRNKMLGLDGSQASILETLKGAADLVKMMDQSVIAPPATEEEPTESNTDGNGNGKP